jgi:16S rRNA (guanine966-N2)-methyltransferase
VRVIAGEAKGRRLAGSRHATFRPTTGRVREALFSTLGAGVAGARILDLYAGSGALGIEALSRGAASAVFVDPDPAAVAAIRANLDLTGLHSRASVLRLSAERFVARAPEGAFDLIFMDPPYSDGLPLEVLAALAGGGFLEHGAEVVVEISAGTDAAGDLAGFDLVSRRRYGDSALLFLQMGSARP